jgi:hypothetical protein
MAWADGSEAAEGDVERERRTAWGRENVCRGDRGDEQGVVFGWGLTGGHQQTMAAAGQLPTLTRARAIHCGGRLGHAGH